MSDVRTKRPDETLEDAIPGTSSSVARGPSERDELQARLTAAQERIAELEAWAQESRVAHMKADEARLRAECRLQRIVEAGNALADAAEALGPILTGGHPYLNAIIERAAAYRKAVGGEDA